MIRSRPEDFVVEEIPAYEPSGQGDHLFVTFRKTGLTTLEAVKRIARALGADPREAGFAGMKDRHAITTQTASFPLAPDCDPDAALRDAALGEIELCAWRRHGHKLKTGHLRGNRFEIVLRSLDPADRARIDADLHDVAARGVPNAFGTQRFGREGDNARAALGWLVGGERAPRGKREQRLLFSALQSHLFNQLLELRQRDGSWDTVLGGDLAHKHDTGGMFEVPLEGPELEDARARAAAGLLCATGPMFGARMRRPAGAPAELEQRVLADAGIDERVLGSHPKLGKGTRRPLRLLVRDLAWRYDDVGDYLTVRFVLPKGGYATTVLSRAFQLVDPRAVPAPRDATSQ